MPFGKADAAQDAEYIRDVPYTPQCRFQAIHDYFTD